MAYRIKKLLIYLKKKKFQAKIIEDTIKSLEEKINTADKFEVFNYSAKDILISRDIAFINSKLHPDEYQERIKTWNKRTREEKETYLEVLEDMHNNRIISNNIIDDIFNNKNNINEKDDFEL